MTGEETENYKVYFSSCWNIDSGNSYDKCTFMYFTDMEQYKQKSAGNFLQNRRNDGILEINKRWGI